jgi:hypothetical protein
VKRLSSEKVIAGDCRNLKCSTGKNMTSHIILLMDRLKLSAMNPTDQRTMFMEPCMSGQLSNILLNLSCPR